MGEKLIANGSLFKAGKTRFSGTQKCVLLKPSSGEHCAPCNFLLRRYTCSPHHVPHHVPNEIDYVKINVDTNLSTACIHQNDWPHWMFLWCLHCYFWKDFTPPLSISFLNLGMCFWLHLPAEIKVQITKHASIGTNYVILTKQVKVQHESKLIGFENYADCRFWANIDKIYSDFGSAKIIYL